MSLSRRVSAWGVALIFLLMGGVAFAILVLRDRETENWRQQMGSMSLMLAEQTGQATFSAYLVLNAVTERVKQYELQDEVSFRRTMSSHAIHDMLREKIHGLPQIDVATVVASNGDNLNFTRAYPVPNINLADRDYFQAHVANPNLGDFISKPVKNKGNGQWTFYISRRLNSNDGKFLGLVLVGLSVEAFTNFYEQVGQSLGEGAAVNLYRRDLTLLARFPRQDDAIGKVNTSGATHEVFAKREKDNMVMLLNSKRFATGETQSRLVAVRTTRDYPLVLSLVVTDAIFLASWRQSVYLILVVTAAAILALALGLRALIFNLRQREEVAVNLRKAKEEAESASLAKSRFLASMSHEIRTPLNGVLGMAQIMKTPQLPDDRRLECAQILMNSGNTLLAILNDILDMSKIEAGKVELSPQVFDVKALLAEVTQVFRALATSKGLAIECHWRSDQSGFYEADAIRLRQILSNMLSNAIKFTEHGTVSVEGTEVSRDAGVAVLEFKVIDRGIGIPAEKLALLFKPFTQADSSITRKFGGTGLGLSIAKSLSQMMGGDVELQSIEGQGTTVTVRIQAAISTLAPPTVSGPGEPVKDPAAGASAQQHSWVMVVDDHPMNRKVAEMMLDRAGHECRTFDGGQVAIDVLKSGQQPSLVLMDCEMPGLDGLETTRLIRQWEAQEGRTRVPIVALTANAYESDRLACLEAGMDDFLAKPVSLQELGKALKHWIPAR